MAPARIVLTLVVGLLCTSFAFAHNGVDHSAEAPTAGLDTSPDMSNPCYTDPTAASCSTFQLSAADITNDLTLLCDPEAKSSLGGTLSMPFMTGCELMNTCEEQTGGELTTQSTGQVVAGDHCNSFTVLASACTEDMAGMRGCERYFALCAEGSVVPQCTETVRFVGMQNVTTYQAWSDVESICKQHEFHHSLEARIEGHEAFLNGTDLTPSAGHDHSAHVHGRKMLHNGVDHGAEDEAESLVHNEAVHTACDMCIKLSDDIMDMAEWCPEPLLALSQLCAYQPDLEECEGWAGFCSENEAAFPEYCSVETLTGSEDHAEAPAPL